MPSKNHEYDDLPIDALPMLLYAIEGALDAAKDQLMNMQKAKDKPHVLDDEIISQIIKSHTKQNNSITGERATCLKWKKGKVSAKQKISVEQLLKTLDELELVNQQILFIAENCKEHTIDKILAMDGVDLALSYLGGKLYPPVKKENKNTSASKPAKNKAFKLPPEVSCQKKTIYHGGMSYTFRHNEWGELGRIDVVPQGAQSQINAFVTANDPEDPLGEMRIALFRTIALGFNNELEKNHGKGVSMAPRQSDESRNKKMVESKVMVCETCDAPVAMLIFAPDAYTPSELEDYARMMYSNTKKLNLPTWVIGAEEEVVPDKEGIALILKAWPNREPAKKISSLVFEPMMDKLQNNHCK
ncbi:MAG: hypothetical protein WCR08_14220 [Gammaproteobacteria bacterium]